jgi:hypothetical protein
MPESGGNMAGMAAVLEGSDRIRRGRGRPKNPTLRDQQVKVAYLRLATGVSMADLMRMTGRTRACLYGWIKAALTYEECEPLRQRRRARAG